MKDDADVAGGDTASGGRAGTHGWLTITARIRGGDGDEEEEDEEEVENDASAGSDVEDGIVADKPLPPTSAASSRADSGISTHSTR